MKRLLTVILGFCVIINVSFKVNAQQAIALPPIAQKKMVINPEATKEGTKKLKEMMDSFLRQEMDLQAQIKSEMDKGKDLNDKFRVIMEEQRKTMDSLREQMKNGMDKSRKLGEQLKAMREEHQKALKAEYDNLNPNASAVVPVKSN